MKKTKQNQSLKLPLGCITLSKKSLMYKNHFLKLGSDAYDVYYDDHKLVVYKLKKSAIIQLSTDVKDTMLFAKDLLMSCASKLLKVGNKNRLQNVVRLINQLDKIK